MIYRYSSLTVTIAIAALTLASCSSNPSAPADENSPIHDMSGKARLYDECNTVQTEHAGIAVSIEGTSITTTTAGDGSFIFPSLPTGTYTLTFSREGYSPYTISDYPLEGSRSIDVGNITLRELPTWRVDDFAAQQEETVDGSKPYLIRLDGRHSTPSCPDNDRYVVIFIGNSAAVSPENHVASINYLPHRDSSTFNLSIDPEYLSNHGIRKGERAYFVAYPSSSLATLHDSTANRDIRIHMGTEQSNIASTIVP